MQASHNTQTRTRTHTSFALLLLCLLLLSSSQSLLSPNLTAAARELGFSDEARDLYLGAYLSLAYSVVSLPVSQLSGFLTDLVNRRRLLCACVALGGFSIAATTASLGYVHLFIMRALSGSAFGAAVPIAFSLMADMFPRAERASASAFLSTAIGAGLMLGSLFAGIAGPTLGWQFPFGVVGVTVLLFAVLTLVFMEDIVRGELERQATEYSRKPAKERVLTFSTMCGAVRVPTNVLLLLQALPNSLPWGILSTHMNDFLTQEKGLSVREATALVGAFGLGAAVGAVGGSLVGGMLYKQSKSYLPLFMGITSGGAGVALSYLLEDNDISVSLRHLGFAAVCGALASVNGANTRTVLVNVTSPEARGMIVSLFNTANSLGRGVGPLLLVFVVDHSEGRGPLIIQALALWSICGLALCFISLTLPRDEDRLEKQEK